MNTTFIIDWIAHYYNSSTSSHLFFELLTTIADVNLEKRDNELIEEEWIRLTHNEKKRIRHAFCYIVCYVYNASLDGFDEDDGDFLFEYINNWLWENDFKVSVELLTASIKPPQDSKELEIKKEYLTQAVELWPFKYDIVSQSIVDKKISLTEYEQFKVWYETTPSFIRDLAYDNGARPWLDTPREAPDECPLMC